MRFLILQNQGREEDSTPDIEGATDKANTSEIEETYPMLGSSGSSSKANKSARVGKGL